ncbi:branched-chain amino acid ABC transporter permease [Rhodococcus qingshengii]
MDLLLTLVLSGLVAGLLYGLLAYGLSLILSVNKVFHVAQGGTFILAAYSFYTFSTVLNLPLVISVIGTVAVAALAAVAMQYLVYRPLAARGANSMTVLVASLLLVAFGQYLVQLFWGPGALTVKTPSWFNWSTTIAGLRIDAYDLSVILVSILVYVGMNRFLNHSRNGLAFRAVGDNPERATALAINLEGVFLKSMILGSILVVPTAVLLAMSAPIQPTMGFDLLLKAVVALTIGGMGRMGGALIGGMLVGLAEAIPSYWLPIEWAEFVLYAVAFAFVIFRPNGLLSDNKKEKKVKKRSNGKSARPLEGVSA